MRVIGGKAKGREIKVPRLAYGRRIRPLTDGTREALFNILQPYIAGKDFLDLFAGTGAVGIEALSRGARVAMFVEVDKRVAQSLRENLRTTDLDEGAEVYTVTTDRAVKLFHRNGAKFDIIFLGPPYPTDLAEKTLTLLSQYPIFAPGAVIIAEHPKRRDLPNAYGGLVLDRQKQYGDTMLSFYNWRGTEKT